VIQDLLEEEVQVCMWCGKVCTSKDGTWPQNNYAGEAVMDADLNNREKEEFVCYDCLE